MKKKNDSKISKNEFLKKNKFEIILFLLTFLTFSNTINNGYNLDDEFVTGKNTLYKNGIRGIKKIFTSHYTEGSETKYNYEYRPIVKASYALEHSIFGANPRISHLINIILYGLAIIVLYRFLLFLFRESYGLLIFLICILYAVHPLHSEVVASLKNRDEILAMAFGLLMCRYMLSFLTNKKYSHFVFGVVFFLFSFFSKRDGIIFLFALPIMAIYFYRKETNWIWLSALLIVPFVGKKLIRKALVSNDDYDRVFFIQENPLYQNHSFLKKIGFAISSFLFYLKIFIFPYPLRFFYGFNQVEETQIFSLKFLFALILVISLIYFAIKFFRTDKILSFGIVFYLLSITPFLNVITPAVGIVAERFAFIPGIGLCIVFIKAIAYIFKFDFHSKSINQFGQLPAIFKTLFILIALIFTSITFSRNFKWKDRMTLFTHDIQHLPNSAKAHEILATEYYSMASKSQDFKEKLKFADSAIINYKRAAEIFPDYFTAYNSLGSVYFNLLNNPIYSIPYFEKALKIDSNYVPAIINLSAGYLYAKDTVNALKNIQKAIKKENPITLNTLLMASKIYNSIKNYDLSDEYMRKAKKQFPLSDFAHVQHANILMERKDTASAIDQLKYSIDKQTKNEQVYKFLIGHYARKGNLKDAEYYTGLLRNLNQIDE
ncbi:MAG: tetratricopeptide repeat protein [Bacteroidota bacterium]|jgi:tetratricopeptide (TPR) repeat protein